MIETRKIALISVGLLALTVPFLAVVSSSDPVAEAKDDATTTEYQMASLPAIDVGEAEEETRAVDRPELTSAIEGWLNTHRDKKYDTAGRREYTGELYCLRYILDGFTGAPTTFPYVCVAECQDGLLIDIDVQIMCVTDKQFTRLYQKLVGLDGKSIPDRYGEQPSAYLAWNVCQAIRDELDDNPRDIMITADIVPYNKATVINDYGHELRQGQHYAITLFSYVPGKKINWGVIDLDRFLRLTSPRYERLEQH